MGDFFQVHQRAFHLVAADRGHMDGKAAGFHLYRVAVLGNQNRTVDALDSEVIQLVQLRIPGR